MGARVSPVWLNHSHESGVGSAEAAIGSASTTGIMAGGSPRKRASRSASNASSVAAMKSERTRRLAFSWPLMSGTWETTHFTRRSIAPTARTWPPE